VAEIGVEHHVARLARGLGPVHGGVGVLDDRLGLRVRPGHRDAHAGGDVLLAAAERDRLQQRGHDAPDDLERRLLGGGVLAQGDELVTADARDGVAGAQRAAQPPRQGEQQLVADGVAQAVVDELEVVDVDEEHRRARATAPRPRDPPVEALEQQRAVGQPGQRVVQCLVADLLLRAPPRDGLGEHVGDRLQEAELLLGEAARQVAVGAEHAERLRPRPDDHAHAAGHAVLGEQRAGREALLGREVLDDHLAERPPREAGVELRADRHARRPDQPVAPPDAGAQDERVAVLAGLQELDERRVEVLGDDLHRLVHQLRDRAALQRAAAQLRDGELLGGALGQLGPRPVGGRHVVGEHEPRAAAGEGHVLRAHLDVDEAAVLAPVPPDARPDRADRPAPAESALQLGGVVGRPDVEDRHREELGAAVAVVAHRRRVDLEEAQVLLVVHPHGQRVPLEEHAIAGVGLRHARVVGARRRSLKQPAHARRSSRPPCMR